MPKKSHRKTYQSQTASFLRRPIVQIGTVAVVAIVVILLILSANASVGNSASLPRDISVGEAHQMYQEGVYVLDVRRQDEWDQIHIENTHLIPLDQLASRVNEIPTGVPIVVICHSGNRSKVGRDTLLQAGFTQVTSVTGGLLAWQAAGYALVPPGAIVPP
jgi:rhodanese-related sulfurtransferase